MDIYKAMQAFAQTVQLGSFVKAAEYLQISPQAVAKHVAALEQHLGAVLIQRTTRQHQVSEIGQRYLYECQQILEQVESAQHMVRESKSLLKGLLRISVPQSFGSTFFNQFIQQFLKDYPELDLDIQFTDRYVDLIRERIDVVIRIGHLASSSHLIARPLGDYRLLLCASVDYLKQRQLPSTPFDLEQHVCLSYCFPNDDMLDWVWLDANKKTIQPKLHYRLRMDDSRALISAAIEGIGITIAPEMLIRSVIEKEQLIEVLSEYQLSKKPVNLLYLASKKRNAKLNVFIDAVLAYFL